MISSPRVSCLGIVFEPGDLEGPNDLVYSGQDDGMHGIPGAKGNDRSRLAEVGPLLYNIYYGQGEPEVNVRIRAALFYQRQSS
jgi:hypothetical protein